MVFYCYGDYMYFEKIFNSLYFLTRKANLKFLLISIITAGIFLSPSASRAFELGIGTHITYYRHDTFFYIDLLKQYGFTSFREEIPWTSVETDNNVYKIPENRIKNDQFFMLSKQNSNISPMFLLVYGHKKYTNGGYPSTPEEIRKFADYAAWIAERYKGKVKYYEIWNEWLRGTGIPYRLQYTKPDDAAYLSLIKQTSQAIKAIDPNAIVITGSFSPLNEKSKDWIFNLINNGLLNYVDGLSIHPYSYTNSNKKLRTAEGNLEAIDYFENELKIKYKKEVPLYITEMGVPTYAGDGGLSENDVGLFAIKYTLMAKSRSYIKGIWWYDLIDDGNDRKNKENTFGFFKNNSSPKVVAQYFLKYKDVLDGCHITEISSSEKSAIECGGKIHKFKFDNSLLLQQLDTVNKKNN